jgi:hypothetical protein
MSVKPVLLKDLRRDAIRNHQANTGNGSYNRFSPLVTRERSLSTAKRQLSNDEDDSDTDTRKRTKVDGQAIFDQLKNQDTMISELEELIKASTPVASSQEDAEPPPAPDPVWKAIGLLLKLHKGVLSAVIDWGGKGSTISRGNVPLSLVEARGTPVKKRINPAPVPVPAPSPEETAEKKHEAVYSGCGKETGHFQLGLRECPLHEQGHAGAQGHDGPKQQGARGQA